ncbi:MAG: hypothetical protein Ta2B_01170 [Termitinemataceae bacterium]|nr:MAG: hypothetical protein Ta2B_01170 [Termitinemataceae bacterium]
MRDSESRRRSFSGKETFGLTQGLYMKQYRSLLLAIPFIFVCTFSNAQTVGDVQTLQNIQSIEKIDIRSSWAGWEYDEDTLTLSAAHIAMPEWRTAVERVLYYLAQPEIATVKLENFGINQQWLQDNAEAWLDTKTDWSSTQKELLRNSICNSETVEYFLQDHYRRVGSLDDNYSAFQMTVSYKNGKHIIIESRAQLQFMLPWKIYGTLTSATPITPAQTYNTQLSMAIAALLPDNFVNKDRIAGSSIGTSIAKETEWRIRDELSMTATRDQIGSEMQQIEKRFIITKSAFTRMSSFDLSGESVWDTILAPKDGPINMIVHLSMFYENKKLESLAHFFAQIEELLTRTRNVPWIKTILENPKNTVSIRFVNNKSMNDKVQNRLRSDFKYMIDAILKEYNNQLDTFCLLTISDNNENYFRCILLPDRRTILWEINGYTDFRLRPSPFQAWEWYGARGIGAVILPNGTLAR